MRVLIAEDSKLMQARIKAMISDIPNIEIVAQTETVSESIQSIEKFKPDIVLLDIRMPGGSGLDILKSIEKNGHAPKTIVLTNYPYPQYKKKCREAGADYFYDKASEFQKAVKIIEDLSGKDKPEWILSRR